MNNKRNDYDRMLFKSAALFNWLVGFLFIFSQQSFFAILNMPPVENPLFLQLFALLVIMFGLGYYWISQDPVQERSLILLGCIAKALVFLTFTVYFYLGQVSSPLLVLATIDLIYSLTFAESLIRQQRLSKRRSLF